MNDCTIIPTHYCTLLYNWYYKRVEWKHQHFSSYTE